MNLPTSHHPERGASSDPRHWFWQPFDYRLPIYLLLGLLGILVLMELGCPPVSAQTDERYTLTIGPINQTESERTECYATIGFNPKEGFMIAAPPGAIVCLRLQELADRKVKGRLVFEVEK